MMGGKKILSHRKNKFTCNRSGETYGIPPNKAFKLIHFFMLYEVSKVFHNLKSSFFSWEIVIAIFSIIATILVSISWHFVEKPIAELKRFFNYTEKQPIQ
jgi:hypothetical protein